MIQPQFMFECRRGMTRLISLLVLTLTSLTVLAQTTDRFPANKWAVSGEVYGTSLAIAGYGEYRIVKPKVTYSIRSGFGRTSFYWDEGDAFFDNLCFPHVFTAIFPLSQAYGLHLEMGLGGSVDLFEYRNNIWVPDERSRDVLYRFIPGYLGMQKLNENNYLFRYFLTLNRGPFGEYFPMIGFSFGGLIE